MTEPGIRPSAAIGHRRVAPPWMWGLLTGAAFLFLSSTYWSIAVNSLSLGLMGVLWVAIMLVERRWLIASTPLDLFFLAYAIAELLATAFSVNINQSLLFSKRLLLIAIVYFFASMMRDETQAKRYTGMVLGSAVLVAVLGVLKLLFADPLSTRRLGIFQFYMTTSEVMMIAALMLIAFAVHPASPSKIRWAAIAGLVPVLISLYATVTRGAYIATGAGILFIGLVRNKRLLMPGLLVMVAVVVFAPPYVQQRILSIVDPQHPDNVVRLMLWGAGLRIFADHPVFGVGDIDLHELLIATIKPTGPFDWGHLHNVPLHLLVTLGAVGFAAVAALFVKILLVEWKIYRRRKDEWFAGSVLLGALAVFVGFQVSGLTEWSFGDQEVVVLFWISLGLSLGLDRLQRAGRGTSP